LRQTKSPVPPKKTKSKAMLFLSYMKN
jgi:hypothetical protein